MRKYQSLTPLVNPSSLVLVGASDRPGSIGHRTLINLNEHSEFTGDLYLVNPTRTEINGHRCWPSVSALPATPDLVIVAVPAASALAVLEESAARGVRFAIVLTSGFGEVGEEGKHAEARMKEIAEQSGMRIYGPNCPGLTNVNQRLGFTFSPSFPYDLTKGPIGLATQGGGLGRNVMQAMERGIGIGLWASTGNEVDLQVADFIHYMADAPDIKVIITLLEGIKDGAKFVRAVQRATANGKPVVALKIGRSKYGMQAAQSHTASLTGSAEVNSAVFKQLGVIEVDDIDELVDTAWLLARALPNDKEALALYCSSGGAAALTADAVGMAGLTLAKFSQETTALLRANLPDFAAVGNPVDTTATILSNPNIVVTTLGAVTKDPNVGMILFPFPLDYGEITTRAAHNLIEVQKSSPVPIVPIWMSDRLGEGYKILVEHGFAPARSVGKAVKAVQRWVEYGRWRRTADMAYRPALLDAAPPGKAQATAVRSESDAKAWLSREGVTVLPALLAHSAEEAHRIADSMGYPVVTKVVSKQILHKSDVGGVKVGLPDGEAVEKAWTEIMLSVHKHAPDAVIDGLLVEKMAPSGGVELLVGISRDPVFGHVMTFGLGGIYVEIFRDVTRRMLPLTPADAEAMVLEMRCYPLLAGARGKEAADLPALQELLLKISDFVVRHGDRIEEMDLNPVWVGHAGQGAVPLDAVIVERTA
jgi:acyl-CoA synthetase (NDP forming)